MHTQEMTPDSSAQDYLRQGYLAPLPVLEPEEAAKLLDQVQQLLVLAGNRRALRMPHLFFPWAHQLVTDPRVLAPVRAILGDELLVYGTLLLCKQPRDASFVSWHQDAAYAPMDPHRALSAWIALTPSRPENGCMRVIPYSQERSLPHGQQPEENNLLDRGQYVLGEVDERRAVDISLEPGAMSLHHFNLIHASHPNNDDQWRIGFIIRYTTPHLKACPFPLTRVSGTAPLEQRPAPPPGTTDLPTAWQACLAWQEARRPT